MLHDVTIGALVLGIPSVVMAQAGVPHRGEHRARPAARSGASSDTGSIATVDGNSLAQVGRLPNGIRFFVRENHNPPHRAELRLIVNAGSMMEDSDQVGYAHFVEHMAFNGTAHFPKDSLVEFLRTIGLRFGADLNAETGYDQTTYKLSVPTDSAGLLEDGFEVLQDWAQGITFDSTEVASERGVVLAEWRLRTGGGADPGGRVRARIDSILMAGTLYPQRVPIGTPESIQRADSAALRRFYHDWYRPDLMAVVAVGDFDRHSAVELIRRHFAALKNPMPERPRPARGLPPWHGPLVAAASDSAIGESTVELIFRQPPDTGVATVAMRPGVLRSLMANLWLRRLADLTERGDTRAADLGIDTNCRLPGDVRCLSLSAQLPSGDMESGLGFLVAQLVRFQQRGPAEDELERARHELLDDLAHWERSNPARGSAVFADDYAGYAFAPEPYLSEAQRSRLARAIALSVTAEDMARFARACCGRGNLAIVAQQPAAIQRTLDPQQLVAVLDSVTALHLAPLPPTRSSTGPQLALTVPAAGRIAAERRYVATGVLEWTLSNGMRVLLKPMAAGGDALELRAFAPGGSSVADDSVWPSAAVAGQVVSSVLGWKGASPADLRQSLFGQFATGPLVQILPQQEQVDVTGSPRQAELLFQLLHLAFTGPRADTVAFRRWQTGARAGLDVRRVLRNSLPSPADLLSEVLAGDNRRAGPLAPAEVDSVRLARVIRFYRARFADASNFTVIIVGGFTPDALRPLVEKFLANLPTTHHRERARPLEIQPPDSAIRRTYFVMPTPQALTVLGFHGPLDRSTPDAENRLKTLLNALQIRLTQQLREIMGGTYVVNVDLSFPELDDQPGYVAMFSFASAPDQASPLADTALAEIARFRRGEIPLATVEQVATAMRRATESAYADDQAAWVTRLTSRVKFGWPLDTPIQAGPGAAVSTPTAMAAAARLYFPERHLVHLTLLPKGSAGDAGRTTQ